MSLNRLTEAKKFTEDKLQEIRNKIDAVLEESDYKEHICIVVTGSYGRREASTESDLDWYIIFDKDRDAHDTIADEINNIEKVILEAIPNKHGDSGTFGSDAIVKFSEMQQNIGGSNDTNQSMTRRMLFLLEGTWLYNEKAFSEYRKDLLSKYIKETDSNSIPLFLLNDIIRYYRTITTDFEYKVAEGGKDWGLRNIKLKFSRKLLYFSGVIAVAELYDLEHEPRLTKANELFSKSPLSRIQEICNKPNLMSEYNDFLDKISSNEDRQKLEAVTKENRMESELYCELDELSKCFSENLHKKIKKLFPEESHPIQHALVF